MRGFDSVPTDPDGAGNSTRKDAQLKIIMAIQKPRTRLVNLRLYEEEFASLHRATMDSNARSISDFCRNAIMGATTADEQQNLQAVQNRLTHLEQQLTEFADQVSAIPEKTQHA
jgi:hypothetical protein